MKILHKLLLCLPAEFAHHLAVFGMRLWQSFLGSPRSVPQIISVPSMSLRFSSRVGLAAGFDKNAEVFPALIRMGFGFVEVGTVTPEPQPGNPKPRLFRKGKGDLINHMGFNNCGMEEFRRNISSLKPKAGSTPVFANIGKNKWTPDELAMEDYRKLYDGLKEEVEGFVVNLSSPNTPGLVNLQSVTFLESLASTLSGEKPILVKFSPDLEASTLEELCRWVNQSPRFCGVILTNTSRTLAESIYGAEQGGMSGLSLHTRSLEVVGRARGVLSEKKLLVGVGGINDLSSAQAFRQAGADLVELYTGFVYQGPSLIRQLSQLQ